MRKSEDGFSSLPFNRKNPFLEGAVETVNKHFKIRKHSSTYTNRSAILTAVDDDGHPIGYTSFIRQVKIDDDKFVKVYLDKFKNFFNLSTAATRVFYYFMSKVKPSNDLIIFDMKECLEYTNYKSTRTIYNAIFELVKSEIIARGYNVNIYFINPMCVFNGDRVNFVDCYVKSQFAQEKELDFNEVPLIE